MPVRRVVVGTGVALLAGALGLTAWLDQQAPPAAVPLSGSEMARALSLASPAAGPESTAAPTSLAAASVQPVRRQSVSIVAGQEPSDMVVFRLDRQGRLVVDEATRLDIEKLFAQNEPAERLRKQQALAAALPPAAARELAALMVRYDNYQEAQLQQLPAGQPVNSREVALYELERLQTLRVQYFGTPLADRLFGSEEKQQRELLGQMPIDAN